MEQSWIIGRRQTFSDDVTTVYCIPFKNNGPQWNNYTCSYCLLDPDPYKASVSQIIILSLKTEAPLKRQLKIPLQTNFSSFRYQLALSLLVLVANALHYVL